MQYADLLRLEYRKGELDPNSGALDCAGVVRCVLERLGFPAEMLPAEDKDLVSAMLGARAASVEYGAAWTLLGVGAKCAEQARRVGDVILSEGEWGLHVSILVKEPPHARVLSAANRVGVYTVPPKMITNPKSVWRPCLLK
jgi:hypothetical protein